MIAETYWLNEHCVRHPRISGGVVVMLRYLNAWLRSQKKGECSLDEFKSMLERDGLRVIDVEGTLLVAGLGLKDDWKFYLDTFKWDAKR